MTTPAPGWTDDPTLMASHDCDPRIRCSEVRVRLKFLLGEYLLRELRLPVWLCHAPFPAPADFRTQPENLLRSRPRHLSVLLAEDWPVSESQSRFRFAAGHIQYIPAIQPKYFVSVRGSFEDYFQNNFSAKTRNTVQRRVRKLKELCGGALDFRVYDSPSEMELFLAGAGTVSRLTYQSRLLGCGLPDSPEFKKNVLEQAAAGSVRGYMLYCETKPVAFAYCISRGQTLYYATPGYDPEFAEWSPGTVLLFLLLQNLFQEKCFTCLDFGIGEAQYKALFSTGSATCGNVYFFSPTLKNLGVIFLHAGLDWVSCTIGRLLKCLGAKEGLRKLLRSRTAKN